MRAEDKFVYGPSWKLPTRIRAAGWVFLILGSAMLGVAVDVVVRCHGEIMASMGVCCCGGWPFKFGGGGN